MLDNLIGKRFERLVVKERAEDAVSPSGRRRVRWLCECDCGNEIIAYPDNLKGGKTKSCGCYQNDMNRKRFATHGMTNTHIYGIWSSMKARCFNKNATAYKDYGGRGVVMCDEWKNDFESFYQWALSSGYEQGLSIDRIDNDKNYCPENCRWVTSDVQASNRRSNRNITYSGETHTVTEWAQKFNKNPKTIFNRIYSGWDCIDAITK